MNKYGKVNKTLKIISSMLNITIFIYVAWVLCTPGYYHYLILFGIITLGYLWLKKKLNNWINNRFKSYTYAELTEHKFGSTYRKRFYNNGYLVLILLTTIVSSVCLVSIIISQLDNKLNTEYINAIEYTIQDIFADEDHDITIYKKMVPVIPNYHKVAVVVTVDTMHLILELTETMEDVKKTGVVEENTISYYKHKFENLQNKQNTVMLLQLNVIVSGVAFILFKYSFKELENYTFHRSIELKE